jgi:BspA type Leucine rich repeat region (6 copies)
MKAKRYLTQICLLGALLLALPAAVQAQFDYTDNGIGICTITDYIGSGGAVTIPSTINGQTVTSFGAQAFEGSANSPTSVTIPNSVTSIGEGTFAGCLSLTTITVNSSNPDYSNAIGGYSHRFY